MLKILVVEDNVATRMVLSQLLLSLGYLPVMASDGKRGLQVLEDNPDIAAVITDCQMPHLDGPAMVKEIRKKVGSTLPILIYSAYLGVKEVGGLLNEGATCFLNYPITRNSLQEYLGRHLSPELS